MNAFHQGLSPPPHLTMLTSREKRPRPSVAEQLNPDTGSSGPGKQVCRQAPSTPAQQRQVLISENCGTRSAPARLEMEPGGQILQLCNRGCLLARHWLWSAVIPLVLCRAPLSQSATSQLNRSIETRPAPVTHFNSGCLPEPQTQ